eukprot:Rhum_TRINITY_DN14616_c9_g1::Rhum_TRINITY_DN14616_c9_g1_i5::g.102328::m.102328
MHRVLAVCALAAHATAQCTSKLSHCPASFASKTDPNPDSSSPCASGNCKVHPTQWQIDRLVEQHNFYRAKHGACPVTYNKAIADYTIGSAGFATTCSTGNLKHNSGSGYGENIAMQGKQIKGHTWDAAEGVFMWYCSEEGCYDYNNGGFSGSTGHFTQVVWKKSLEIGCAICTIQESGYNKVYLMCNYKDPGNYGGQFDANVKRSGTAATGCAPAA